MKKGTLALSVVVIWLLLGQTQTGALQETYKWKTPADTGYSTYQVSLTTSDVWQVDTTVTMRIRLTMISKRAGLDYSEIVSARIVLNSESFTMDSGIQTGLGTLADIDDCRVKEVSFYIPADKVNRGQTLNVSIVLEVTIDEIDDTQTKIWAYGLHNYDNPMVVNLYRPLLSTLECVTIAVIMLVVIAGTAGFALFGKHKGKKIREIISKRT